MSIKHLKENDFRRQAWANGKGTTLEYARRDDGNGQLLWRLSRADVVEDGAFSALPGLDRVISLLSGPGFTLDFGAHGRADVHAPFQPVRFSGDWETRAEGVTAPCQDLNLMTRRGILVANFEFVRTGQSFAAADTVLVLALQGDWQIGDLGLKAGELAILENEEDLTLSGEGLAAVALLLKAQI